MVSLLESMATQTGVAMAMVIVFGLVCSIGMIASAFGISVMGKTMQAVGAPIAVGAGNYLTSRGKAKEAEAERTRYEGMAQYQLALNNYHAVKVKITSPDGAAFEVSVEGREPAAIAAAGASNLLTNTAQVVQQIAARKAALNLADPNGNGSYIVARPRQIASP